jgi:hypothetical protein
LRLGSALVVAGLAWLKRLYPLYAIAFMLTAMWFFQSPQDRFLIPALCFFAVIVAAAAESVGARLRNGMAVVLAVAAMAAVLTNWLPAAVGEASNSLAPARAYLSGRESAPVYLDRRLESHAAAVWLGSKKLAGERVLALDDVRDYYFGPDIVWANPYYQPVWSVDWYHDGTDRWANFVNAGFHYMVVNDNRAYVSRTPTGVDWSILRQDERLGIIRRVFDRNDVIVYELRTPPK